jgi:hypothetical protein
VSTIAPVTAVIASAWRSFAALERALAARVRLAGDVLGHHHPRHARGARDQRQVAIGGGPHVVHVQQVGSEPAQPRPRRCHAAQVEAAVHLGDAVHTQAGPGERGGQLIHARVG